MHVYFCVFSVVGYLQLPLFLFEVNGSRRWNPAYERVTCVGGLFVCACAVKLSVFSRAQWYRRILLVILPRNSLFVRVGLSLFCVCVLWYFRGGRVLANGESQNVTWNKSLWQQAHVSYTDKICRVLLADEFRICLVLCRQRGVMETFRCKDLDLSRSAARTAT